jgi:lysyl-tRNA synthetase
MSGLARQAGAINLGQGFPDEPGPFEIRSKAAELTIHGPSQYPPVRGMPELREAIARFYARTQGLALNWLDEVTITTGAIEGIAASIFGLIEPGDEVVVFQPVYDAYLPLIRRAGGVPRLVTLRPPNWVMDPDELRAAFTSKTRLVLLNTPMNPTAILFPSEQLELLAKLCVEFNCVALCDDVWEHIVFDGRLYVPLMAYPGMRNRTVKVSSAGKLFSLTGWKVGFMTAGPELTSVVSKAHQFLTFTVPPNLQAAVAWGLEHCGEWIEELPRRLQQSRDFMTDALRKEGFAVLPCEGTYFVNVDLKASGTNESDLDFCMRSVKRHRVAAIPCSSFYETRPVNHLIRLCFAKSDETLAEAVRRLAEARDHSAGPQGWNDMVPREERNIQSAPHGAPAGLPIIQTIAASFVEGAAVVAAGRIVSTRRLGRIVFSRIQDFSGRIQVCVEAARQDVFEAWTRIGIGDIIRVEGSLIVTRSGERTISVAAVCVLTAALHVPPVTHHGLRNSEARLRSRSLDLVSHQPVVERFVKRSAIVSRLRSFFEANAFLEFETPLLQTERGGNSRPFETYFRALDESVSLRSAPELYLKQLLIGGFTRIFEIGRNFRNEGLSRNHNPEFTALEAYWAYADRSDMLALVERLIQAACRTATGRSGCAATGASQVSIDLTPPWRGISFRDYMGDFLGESWLDLDENQQLEVLSDRGVPAPTSGDLIKGTFRARAKLDLIQPTFITDLPCSWFRFARWSPDGRTADAFKLYIDGLEIAEGCNELTEAAEYGRRLGEAARGDTDFLRALEFGMPPAYGLGLGVDRLVMLLTGAASIRDVILFPQLRALR